MTMVCAVSISSKRNLLFFFICICLTFSFTITLLVHNKVNARQSTIKLSQPTAFDVDTEDIALQKIVNDQKVTLQWSEAQGDIFLNITSIEQNDGTKDYFLTIPARKTQIQVDMCVAGTNGIDVIVTIKQYNATKELLCSGSERISLKSRLERAFPFSFVHRAEKNSTYYTIELKIITKGKPGSLVLSNLYIKRDRVAK